MNKTITQFETKELRMIPENLIKYYSKEEFKELIKYMRESILPNVESTGQPFYFDITVKYKDLIFRPKRWKGSTAISDIKNSKDNRDASIKPKSKKLPKKLEYVLRILATKSSFNFVPVGMMSDCSNLEAEDRGHAGTLMFCERDTKFPLVVWRKVKSIMDNYIGDTSKTTPHLDDIHRVLTNQIKNKVKEFSINELLPTELCDEINERTIGIQIKIYPNRDYHVDEILGINTTEDTWIVHQKAMKEVVKVLRRKRGMDEMLIEEIYGLVESNDYFLGNKEFFSRHSSTTDKAECAEEEPLWLWMSSLAGRSDDLDKYRGFDCTEESARKRQYKAAIDTYPNKKQWENEKDFLLTIAESNSFHLFESTIDKWVSKLRQDELSYTNLNDLSIGKVDAALMFCLFIRDYIIHLKYNKTKENILLVANIVFEKATELLNDKTVRFELINAGTGAKGRYEHFFKELWNELISTTNDVLNDVKSILLYNAREYFSGTSLNPNADISIIDRKQSSKNLFQIKTINISTGLGLDKGHKDSTLDATNIDNFFLQFEGDNRFFSNKRIFDSSYGKEYIESIKSFMIKNKLNDDEDWEEALAHTKQFVKLWK